MGQRKRLLVIMDPGRGFDRAVIEGVVRSARKNKIGALLHHRPPPRADVPDIGLAGIVTSVKDGSEARPLRRLGIPVVNVGTWQPRVSLPSVIVDNEAIGRLGASYLADRGFGTFGFYSSFKTLFARRRADAFDAALAEVGHRCHRFEAPRDVPWRREVELLAEWLGGLPKPAAIMADNDDAGRHVTEVLARLDMDVPERAAVLGVDNDEIICETAMPPLSSIDTGARQIGQKAVDLVLRLAAGEAAYPDPIRIRPKGVVTRRSTDVVAVSDEMVARALNYIRENAHLPINVMDVLDHVPVSRRTLERGFTSAVGRSPSQEIRRVHVQRAAWLLAFTDWRLQRVADESGFRSFRHFAAVFRKDMGMPPTAYRRDHRG